MLAGPIKYAERTLALRCASNSAIVESVLPLYKFMRLEPWLSLPVKGVGDVQSQDRRERFFYIVSGEHEWYRQLLINNGEANSDSDSLLDAFTEAANQTPSFVTLEDVVSNCRDRTLSRRVHLCLAFALFKLYRRRLTNLYMYEWRTLKIRNLFFRDSPELPFFSLSSNPEKDILSVLDMELRFLFDSIYTKAGGTAYTGIGVIFRILTFVVLMVSAIFIFLPLMRKDLEQQSSLVKEAQLITSLLLIAAIIIEVYQLLRLFVSDWTQVWLICIRIQLLEEQRRQTPSSRNKRMRTSALILLVEWTLVCSENLQLRHVYWRHRIGQDWLLAGTGDVVASTNLQVDRSWRLPLLRCCPIPIPRYESDAQLTARLKSRVMHDIIGLCSRLVSSVLNAQSGLMFPFSELLSIESLQASHWREWREPFHQYCVFVGSNSNFADSETFIVNWHLATIVCEELDRVKFFHPEQPDDNWQQGTESNYSQSELVEKDPNRREEQEAGSTTFYIDEMGDNITETVQMAKLLSRYAMYLLVHKAELLPCHANIGRKAAKNAKRSLQTTLADARQKFLSVDHRNVIGGPQYEANASEKCSQLLHRVIMESRELSVLPDDEVDGGISIQQARNQIEAAVSVEKRHLAKTGRSPINDLKIPEDIKSGLTAGKLMLLGIESRKERWDLIWEIWVEVLACLASPNKAKEHVD
ncbi:hypothetical protein KP509_27G066800 [Ceratopteris richardii]|uniref:DUF4220 domain-containing protein n=1 Tax=Ceratopteris richardii TaxID=49495 RepID=A0A8T2RHD1_CERRI|nr:hypothetical protein KP509_27G066800 [Ceratopteris richardii]